jgi:hypothetical protein
MTWIINNLSTIIVATILLWVVIMIIKKLQKKGHDCGNSYGCCEASSICHSQTILLKSIIMKKIIVHNILTKKYA